MAINYAKAYQSFIDEELSMGSITQWMTPAPGQIKYEGGKDIEISELSTTGLGDYDSTKTDGSAYPQGAVTNTWNTYSLSMDRGVKFALDRTDPADTAFIATAENVMREFTRSQLIKEQDTYRISKIYDLCSDGDFSSDNILTGTITSSNAVGELLKTLTAVQNSAEQISGFVAIINQEHRKAFLEASNTTYNAIEFNENVEINGIKYENVMMFNDLPCLFAPSARMITVCDTLSGRLTETAGGVTSGTGSKKINFFISAFDAPLAVSKIDSLKQFPPEENQLFDGTAIQARYLYDVFVPEAKMSKIAFHTVA